MTPYEIRLELVKVARDMLSEEYHSKRGIIEQEWQAEVRSAMDADAKPPKAPTLPKYFSEDEVVEKALRLNNFISTGK